MYCTYDASSRTDTKVCSHARSRTVSGLNGAITKHILNIDAKSVQSSKFKLLLLNARMTGSRMRDKSSCLEAMTWGALNCVRHRVWIVCTFLHIVVASFVLRSKAELTFCCRSKESALPTGHQRSGREPFAARAVVWSLVQRSHSHSTCTGR